MRTNISYTYLDTQFKNIQKKKKNLNKIQLKYKYK